MHTREDRRGRGKRSPGETQAGRGVRTLERERERARTLSVPNGRYRACTRSCGRPAITLLIEILLPTLGHYDIVTRRKRTRVVRDWLLSWRREIYAGRRGGSTAGGGIKVKNKKRKRRARRRWEEERGEEARQRRIKPRERRQKRKGGKGGEERKRERERDRPGIGAAD